DTTNRPRLATATARIASRPAGSGAPPVRIERPVRVAFAQDRERFYPLARAERGRLDELCGLVAARRITPAHAEAGGGTSADERVGACGEKGIRDEADLALGRGRRVEQGGTMPEGDERDTEPAQLRRAVHPGVVAGRSLVSARHEGCARLGDMNAHDLNPGHHRRVPLDRGGDAGVKDG